VQPAQQHGLRIPPPSFESAFLIRIPRVSAFLPEMTQHIHSLRASGVISSHSARTLGAEAMALRKSSGIACTTPPAIVLLLIDLFYQIPWLWDGVGAFWSALHRNRRGDMLWISIFFLDLNQTKARLAFGVHSCKSLECCRVQLAMAIQRPVYNTKLISVLVGIFCNINNKVPIAAIVLVHTISHH